MLGRRADDREISGSNFTVGLQSKTDFSVMRPLYQFNQLRSKARSESTLDQTLIDSRTFAGY